MDIVAGDPKQWSPVRYKVRQRMIKLTVDKEEVFVHFELPESEAEYFEARGIDMRRGIAKYIARELLGTIERNLNERA